jgi:hypothetical protein
MAFLAWTTLLVSAWILLAFFIYIHSTHFILSNFLLFLLWPWKCISWFDWFLFGWLGHLIPPFSLSCSLARFLDIYSWCSSPSEVYTSFVFFSFTPWSVHKAELSCSWCFSPSEVSMAFAFLSSTRLIKFLLSKSSLLAHDGFRRASIQLDRHVWSRVDCYSYILASSFAFCFVHTVFHTTFTISSFPFFFSSEQL